MTSHISYVAYSLKTQKSDLLRMKHLLLFRYSLCVCVFVCECVSVCVCGRGVPPIMDVHYIIRREVR